MPMAIYNARSMWNLSMRRAFILKRPVVCARADALARVFIFCGSYIERFDLLFFFFFDVLYSVSCIDFLGDSLWLLKYSI